MLSDEQLQFPDDYLDVMEAGPVDEVFVEALGRLTTKQREYLTQILSDRLARRATM